MTTENIITENAAENTKVYNSPDEIPVYEKQHIKPIDFDGLPNFNVIKLFADYIMDVKDSYPEYAWQNGISMLSAIARKRLYFSLNGELSYLNLWTMSLGQSGYARKSGVMSIAKRILSNAVENIFLPEDATPEALIESMASIIELPSKDKGKDKDNSTMESFDMDVKGQIPSSQKTLWKDEAGQMYASMGKAHMQGMGELLNVLHGCQPEYNKKLVRKNIIIKDIYFTMNLTTTPESFMKHMTAENISTGFGPRHLIVSPSYIKPRKPITQSSKRDNEIEQVITKALKIIDNIFATQKLEIQYQEGIFETINEWAGEREEFFAKTENEKMASFFGKYQTAAVKIATLIELGNIPYYIAEMKMNPEKVHITASGDFYINDIYKNEDKDYLKMINSLPDDTKFKLSNITISLASLQFALKMMDSMYMQYIASMEFNESLNIRQNDIQKFYEILEKEKKVNHSIMLKKLGLSSDKLNAIQFDGVMMGHIEVCEVKTKTKPQIWYVYKKDEGKNLVFDINYSNIQIKEFKPDIKMNYAAILDDINKYEATKQPIW